jgi:hypothetical protein
MTALYAAVMGEQQDSLRSGQVRVAENARARDAALRAQQDAIARAERDQPSGFLCEFEKIAMDVAKVAAIVGSVAVTVATAGAGSPLIVAAALTLSIGGAVVSETHCLGDASPWVGLGLTLAGSAFGVGLSMGVSGLSSGMQMLATGGRITEGAGGAFSLFGGGAHIVNGAARAQVELDLVDETQEKEHAERIGRLTAGILSDLQSENRSYAGELEVVQSTLQTLDENQVALASAIRG